METQNTITSSEQQTNSLAVTTTMKELSKEKQLRLIERLFVRLGGMYGQQFVSMWANTNIDEVKALWAEKLGSFTAAEFAEALNLMAEKQFPPNLPEFLSFCRTAQRNHQPGWKPEEVERISKAEAEIVMAKIEAKIGKPKPQTDYRGWAEQIVKRSVSGERIPYIALKMAQEVYRMPAEVTA